MKILANFIVALFLFNITALKAEENENSFQAYDTSCEDRSLLSDAEDLDCELGDVNHLLTSLKFRAEEEYHANNQAAMWLSRFGRVLQIRTRHFAHLLQALNNAIDNNRVKQIKRRVNQIELYLAQKNSKGEELPQSYDLSLQQICFITEMLLEDLQGLDNLNYTRVNATNALTRMEDYLSRYYQIMDQIIE